MKNKNLLIISCGDVKREGAFKAEELYVGLMFRKRLKFARSIKDIDKIMILSGKYGLIELDTIIETYNQKLPKDFQFSAETKNFLNENNVYILMNKDYEKVMVKNNINIKLSLLNLYNKHKKYNGLGFIYQWFNNNEHKSIYDFENDHNINYEFKRKEKKINE